MEHNIQEDNSNLSRSLYLVERVLGFLWGGGLLLFLIITILSVMLFVMAPFGLDTEPEYRSAGALAVSGIARIIVPLFMLPYLLILKWCREIAGSVRNGSPFTTINATRLRNIGVASLVVGVLDTAAWIGYQFLEKRGGVSIASSMLLVSLGLLIVASANVFRYGVLLQQEHDLTV